ncbi:MAG TPA: hypothetical protein VFG14_05595 [Chthoniobacteraceae bacterium]|nr:hypothetical protein [Chthoniobacteraceae bacterium]
MRPSGKSARSWRKKSRSASGEVLTVAKAGSQAEPGNWQRSTLRSERSSPMTTAKPGAEAVEFMMVMIERQIPRWP